MYSFALYGRELFERGAVHAFLLFFIYVWALWLVKAALAARYRPALDRGGATSSMRTSVLVPVFDEAESVFRRALASVAANGPTELIVAVDGGDDALAAVAAEHADRVVRLPKLGKRRAIEAALAVSDPTTDVVVVLDSDTVWRPDTLVELLKPFADERVGGVTPRQEIFEPAANGVRRLADWIEDLRYHLTVPAQSVLGQVGCLAGRTIAYRRASLEPAVRALVHQRVFGLEMHIGDDRVLTNELLRHGWRTVYQSTSSVATDAPNTWRQFWRQQLRWGRSSQRETLLSLRWLWRRPFALWCFASDIILPFWLYGIFVVAIAHMSLELPSSGHGPLHRQLALAYAGMVASIGVRQAGHFRRRPRDLLALPVFVLQLTFLMAPTRILAFATMFHQPWGTRAERRPAADPAAPEPGLAQALDAAPAARPAPVRPRPALEGWALLGGLVVAVGFAVALVGVATQTVRNGR